MYTILQITRKAHKELTWTYKRSKNINASSATILVYLLFIAKHCCSQAKKVLIRVIRHFRSICCLSLLDDCDLPIPCWLKDYNLNINSVISALKTRFASEVLTTYLDYWQPTSHSCSLSCLEAAVGHKKEECCLQQRKFLHLSKLRQLFRGQGHITHNYQLKSG